MIPPDAAFSKTEDMYCLGSLVIDDDGKVTDTCTVDCIHYGRRICVTDGDDEMLSYCKCFHTYSPEDLCAKCKSNKKR